MAEKTIRMTKKELFYKVGTNNKLWSSPPTQTTIAKVRKQVNQGRGPTSIKGWEGEGTFFAKSDISTKTIQ